MRGMPNFLRDDKGSQTIEFVLWLPIIGALLVIISYASIFYAAHTEMWNVARDTARRMSTGVLDAGVPAEDYAKSQLRLYEFFSSGYDVEATKDGSRITVEITLDVANGSFDGGYLGSFTLVGGLMSARVVMPNPPNPPVFLAAAGGGSGGGGSGIDDDDDNDDDDHDDNDDDDDHDDD